jgi:hypothetical protein
MTMATCGVCGNDYAGAFRLIEADGTESTFDSFECAIHRVAPRCAHCGCPVIGHGEDVDGRTYCCAHCARHSEQTAAGSERQSQQDIADQELRGWPDEPTTS